MAKRIFAILCGPSCVGKGPLVAALDRFHPDLDIALIPVVKSRESRVKGPRPEEGKLWNNPDFFRDEEELLGLAQDPRYLVGDCRGLPQAVDLEKIPNSDSRHLLVEIHHSIGLELAKTLDLADTECLTLFLSPLGRQEVQDLKAADVDLCDYLTQLMLHKQMARARYHGKTVDASFIRDAKKRAGDSLSELQSASHFSRVIVNHDGEGHLNWNRLPNGVFQARPEGDAGRALRCLAGLLADTEPVGDENWNDLLL